MREIRSGEILTFGAVIAVPLLCCVGTYVAARRLMGQFELAPLLALVAAIVILYVSLLAAYRTFIRIFPVPKGEIPPSSRVQFTYNVQVLFFLIFFYPIIRSGLFPAPIMRVFYIALGAKLGANTYSQGIIHDPMFVTIGRDSVVGQSALIIPHIIEREHLAHHPVIIGDDVTIGANAVILSNVEIGNGAIVAAGAVVTKGTRIGAGEVWGGVPARRIRP